MTDTAAPTGVQIAEMVARGLAFPERTPILKRPDTVGLDYEDVFFPALDGTVLEGWLIPADSGRVVICNHFGPANRQGYPGHLEGWNSSNGVEVDFLPKYKALHDAGYNVLAYDLRNHGLSSAGAGGICATGLIEWRDVIGSLRYIRSRPDTKDMAISLQSMCIGADSTFVAMAHNPAEFDGVRSMIAIQPLTGRSFAERALEAMGVPEAIGHFETAIQLLTSFKVDDYDMTRFATAVTIPTLVVQVRDDLMTREADVQAIYDAIPAVDKEMFWIGGTSIRHHGYTYFAEHPEKMIDWYNSHP
ncbi:alpha/beta hydrolase family protein [Rhodococcus spongiicola]|nr:alpha/beta hydrolase [Rhodococcus spongiicola]